MGDIVADLRECAADSRASEVDHYADQFATAPEIFERAADEIERLRLTNAELAAVEECVKYGFPATHPTAMTLRGLLKRQVFSQKNMTDRDT